MKNIVINEQGKQKKIKIEEEERKNAKKPKKGGRRKKEVNIRGSQPQ